MPDPWGGDNMSEDYAPWTGKPTFLRDLFKGRPQGPQGSVRDQQLDGITDDLADAIAELVQQTFWYCGLDVDVGTNQQLKAAHTHYTQIVVRELRRLVSEARQTLAATRASKETELRRYEEAAAKLRRELGLPTGQGGK